MWTGDNLPVMRGLNSESVDLIYLDPPFNSNKTYSAPIGSNAAGDRVVGTLCEDLVDVGLDPAPSPPALLEPCVRNDHLGARADLAVSEV